MTKMLENWEITDNVYTYYTTRKDNPLKGMQAMVAVSCKLIRIFYALLTHGHEYSSTRFRADILRPEQVKAAWHLQSRCSGKRPSAKMLDSRF